MKEAATKPITARCGNRCDLCPLFRENFNPGEAPAVNAALFKYHCGSTGPRPRHSRGCDGCLGQGHLARERCPIRACAIGRGFSTCARCPEMYCRLLEHDMAIIEEALSRHGATLSLGEFDAYFRPFLIREALAELRRRDSVG